ncbi:hypothetical protein [Sphingobium nicotianae]|uniref:Uncharacterized protein n=1 Tax=Sphingobium nicotianae TaxID=2782607 RepID=A0A9X1DFS3_9SPHN|nr:hypothetical protein [Sphingobium nicotianae]MBT2189099.1 hypothetical protein [Sphingobium nicotianae]
MKPSAPTESRQELIRAYKCILKDAVEARPSGIRLRIADMIGKNKSFVSQVTNPKYSTPLPESYIEPIFDAVHMTPKERERFLDLYHRAHPRAARAQSPEPAEEGVRVVKIELPRLATRQLEAKVDQMILQIARNLSELAKRG